MDLRLFGPMEVADAHGRTVAIRTRKQRAVLALLAVEPGRVVSLDRLVDEVWSGEPPASATASLQVYVAQLRKALEPGRAPRTPPAVLLTREPGYLLAVAPGQVDLVRFEAQAGDGRRALTRGEYGVAREHLDRALATWRGEPLGEFAGFGFAQPVAARLAEVRAVAVEDLFEARLAVGEDASCVPDLERLIEVHPYRERLWGLLVLALYRAGRQADALGALRRVRSSLSDELGLEPGPELRHLERAVFDQSPTLLTHPPLLDPPPSAPPAPTTPPPPESPYGTGGGLIARGEEVRRVGERLAEARRGRGGVLLVTGEAGIGKTRLAQAAADEAAAIGMTVAWGRCAEDTGAPAFWPWLQALPDLSPTALEALTGAPGPAGGDGDRALFVLHERVTQEIVAGVPALVVLDDLHWADASSLRLLAFVAARLHRAPVLVLVTMRPEPGGDPAQLRDALGALVREPGTERMPLPPFTPGDVSSYLGDLDDPALAEVLHRRTAGNPFYLGELVRLLGGEHRLDAAALGVPEGVREVIGRRVARLPERTGEVLRAAAVLGRDVAADLLERSTGSPLDELVAALEPAVATGLLHELPGGFDYRFSHPLVRDALYAGLGRLDQARLHLRAGEALEGVPGAEPSLLAHHFGMAARVGGAAKAVEHAVRVARRSQAQHAYDEAAHFWGRALDALGTGDPSRRCELLVEHGRALRALGDVRQGQARLEEAIDLAAATGDRAAQIAAITVFGEAAVWNWRAYGVVEHHAIALLEHLLAGPLPDADRAALLGTLAVELHYSERREEGERHALEAVAIARRLGDPALLARVLNNYTIAAWVPDREEERRAAVEELLAVPGLPAGPEIVARVIHLSNLLRSGEFAAWERDLARCRRLLDQVRSDELAAMVLIGEAAWHTLHGRWAEAERLADQFTGLLAGSGMWGPEHPGLITLFVCRRAQGRTGELLDRLVAAASRDDMSPLRPVAVLAALDSGATDLARDLLARWGTEIRDDWTAEFLVPVWGLVAARLGVPDPRGIYDRLLPYASRLIVGGMGGAACGSMHGVLAELAAAMGDPGLARDHARRARETHERLGLTYWATRSARLLDDLQG